MNDRRKSLRDGVAVTEFAIVLPVFVTLSLVPIELCNLIHVRQSLEVASYEAVRISCKKLGNQSTAVARSNQILADRGIKSATTVFSPDPHEDAEPGDQITVSISAPYSVNSVFGMFLASADISSQSTMMKE